LFAPWVGIYAAVNKVPRQAANCSEAKTACGETALESAPGYAGACAQCEIDCLNSCQPAIGCTWPMTFHSDSCQYWRYDPKPPYPAGYSDPSHPGPFPGSGEVCVSWPDRVAVGGLCKYHCNVDLECERPASDLEITPRQCFEPKFRWEMTSCTKDYFCSNVTNEPIEIDDPLNPGQKITVCFYSCHDKLCQASHVGELNCQVRTRPEMDRGCEL